MENNFNISSENDKIDRNENNKNYELSKISKTIQENDNKKEKLIDNNKTDNSIINNDFYESNNNSETSFPLLFQ